MTDDADTPAPAAKATRNIGLGLIAVIGTLIGLHLVGDRLTPYSSQARMHANIVAIAPEVGGRVEAIKVRNNQLVKKGQPLFVLGGDSFAIAAEKARADISATQRELAAQQAGISVASANLAAARAELEKDAADTNRLDRIYREDAGAISVRRLEVARAGLHQSQAKVQAALGQLEQARAARGQAGDANDRLVAARTALARAELDQQRTTVVAPGDGLITDLRTDVGQFAGAGAPVMTFIAIHDGWVTADMTENNLGHVTVGARAEVVLDVTPGRVYQGRVRSIGYGVNSGGKAQPGSLPDIQNSRDFLRQAQRFPVIIEFDRGSMAEVKGLREGGQADVIVYTGDNGIMNWLGRIYIRAMGLLSYAY